MDSQAKNKKKYLCHRCKQKVSLGQVYLTYDKEKGICICKECLVRAFQPKTCQNDPDQYELPLVFG